MNHLTQHHAPIADALIRYQKKRVVPFDVPGHKRGRGNEELVEFLGAQCLAMDVNSMKPLDNLVHPVSVIKEAELLAAEAFGAKHAFFMVNGTTSAVQAMIMTACRAGDKIILPRNVHRSSINALILSGATPIYVNPGVHQELGIPLGMAVEDVKRAIQEHPDAKAIFVNNPTYYGICSNLQEITKLAHEHGMLVLADEAHGTHFYFGDNLPISAMAAGADMAAVSMHKSGGSLTQSSFLLINNAVSEGYTRQIINLTQTTSGSYLLLSSLDLSRKKLALQGRDIFQKVVEMARYTRHEINQIGDYYAFSSELINGDTVFDFDETKLAVHTRNIGLAGVEVYDLLRDEYDIQIEFGDVSNLLAYISVGDRSLDIERLVAALSEIRRRYMKDASKVFVHEYIKPIVQYSPQQAFYADKVALPLDESAGKIAVEFVMCYPPGIPIVAPGERITTEIIQYIAYCKEKGCFLTGTEDPEVCTIQVMKEEN